MTYYALCFCGTVRMNRSSYACEDFYFQASTRKVARFWCWIWLPWQLDNLQGPDSHRLDLQLASLPEDSHLQASKLSSMLGTPKKRGGVVSAPQGIRKEVVASRLRTRSAKRTASREGW